MAIESVIDTSKIEAMVAQLRAAAARAQGAVDPVQGGVKAEKAAARVDFADVLKGAINQVNDSQQQASKMSQAFALGDDNVNLSDVMIASQKASISFQTSIQVRNKLVSAYRDIMTMQV
ncbi:flagellar hook-basal body complex protein FliE [Herbaspirillum sp. WKF16]|jgi:flagellar hook-basal body complex protein FliE|uniref:flagellar hook-basal body complex protein FliE n=1 Tax=Herbaspirillum sp. WKF16 TaxID=3028312 RepID=UPI0023A9CBF7|nr:flagellar hook-basal body complex protein FliE [Herbaspirillum sp. WKF16]WDZ98041.1 flagellar hook-basal body complex protein FliE [Herbaspirillum sp. WKF16]